MKKNYLIILVFIAAMVLISFGTFRLGKNATKREKAETVDCSTKGPNHVVEIKDGMIVPESITAKACDELTVFNRDDKLRLIAFGVHDAHIYYSGVTEKALKKDESLTITLNQKGTYLFHDHLEEEVQGYFNVQ